MVSGVPRGSVLGPVLFIYLFLNGLPDNLTHIEGANVHWWLYRDVYREIRSKYSRPTYFFKRTLTHFWHENGLSPQRNVIVLRVSRVKSPVAFNYRLKGTFLAAETTNKYLGVDLQHFLSWNQHVNRVTKNSRLSTRTPYPHDMPAKKSRPKLSCQTSTTAGYCCTYHLEPLPKRPETPSWDGSPMCDRQILKHQHRDRHVGLPWIGDT